MTRAGGGNEWTKPGVILHIVSLVMMVYGGYLITKDNSEGDLAQIRAAVVSIETKLEERRLSRDREMREVVARIERLENRR